MTLRKALYTLLALALLTLAGAWVAGTVASRPHLSIVPPPPEPGRLIHLIARDGVPLSGAYWPSPRPGAPAILLLHGINSSRDSLTRHAAMLNALGYGVLAIDLRGHGASGAAPRTFGLYEARDAAAGLAFLRSGAPHRRVGVIGTSLGGAAALLGDDGPLPVQAMILQAVYPDLRAAIANRIARVAGRPLATLGEPLLSYQSWLRYGEPPGRLAPAEAIRRYAGPVLIIGGSADMNTTEADTRTLYAAAPGPKSLWLLDGVGHAGTGSIWTDEYRNRMRDFFARHLGEPNAASAPPSPATGPALPQA